MPNCLYIISESESCSGIRVLHKQKQPQKPQKQLQKYQKQS